MEEHPDIDCTIHMAARIVVPESVEQPYEYYRDNVAKSLELFDQLVALGKPRVLFSSSASLYALVDDFEVTEDAPLDPPSPYARTKRVMEMAAGGHGGRHRPPARSSCATSTRSAPTPTSSPGSTCASRPTSSASW